MNRDTTVRGRSAVALFLSVALVGCIAGSITAYALRTADPGRQNERGTGSTSSAGRDGADRLFYYSAGRIHDGSLEVPVQLSRDLDVSSVQRVGDGWLVVQLQSGGGEQESYFGTYVYPDGATWELGGLGQTWDIAGDDRVLFSPEPWQWYAANLATHELERLAIVDGPGDDPQYMVHGDPAPWLLWGHTGVLTGWQSSNGSRMMLTETTGYTHAEAGPVGVERPNTSPDGRLAVASVSDDGATEGYCLSGGDVTSERWWRNCDRMRLSYSSPYSPDGDRLLVLATGPRGTGLSEFTILNARTGKTEAQVAAPRGTYAGAWVDDRTLAMLAQGANGEPTRIYRVGLDGERKLVRRLDGQVVLGDA